MARGKSLTRTWFKVHGWIGTQLGLLLFVILFSGTLATVSHEIDWLLNPAMRVAPQEKPPDWGALYEAVQRAYPDERITDLFAPVGSRFAVEVWVQRPIKGEFLDKIRRVYIDPSTVEVRGTAGWFSVQRVLRDFHAWLSMPGYGAYLVEIFSVLLLTSTITALFFYKRWWRAFFRLRVRHGVRLFVSDAHRFMGVWSLWFTLLMALTGIWYLSEHVLFDIDKGFQDIPNAAPTLTEQQLARYGDPPQTLTLDKLVAMVQQAYPGFEIASIRIPEDPMAAIDFTGHADAALVRPRANRVFLNRYDGTVMAVYKAEELPLIYRWVHTADPLHFGNFGGLTTKLIWFFFGLLSSAMTLTGAYLWCKRTHRLARGPEQAKVPPVNLTEMDS